LRVLHLVPALFGAHDGVFGGGERYALELARNMAEATPTRLLTFGDRERTESAGPLEIQVLERSWQLGGQLTNPLAPGLLPALLWADVIHCHQQHVAASSLAAVFSRLSNRFVCTTDLGGGGLDLSSVISTDRLFRLHLHLSAYSRAVAGQERSPRARVIGGGVDVQKFSPNPAVARQGFVLFVGRLLPHKGVDTLVEAMPPDLPLRILGRPYDSHYLGELRRLAERKAVTFSLDGTDDDIVAAYQRASCIVLPSVYSSRYAQETRVPELLGQTLLEGMACGTPPICTNVASLPEIVVNGTSGIVVEPNQPDALREAILSIANGGQGEQIGQAARARVLDEFTWPKVVARCLDAYSSVLSPAAAAGTE
jgi:glycosyltransferase involved in cell wall biosynthesis